MVADVRVREVVGTVKVVDGDSLLSAPLLEKIVSAVLQAMASAERDEHRRRDDVRIGGACCDRCATGERR